MGGPTPFTRFCLASAGYARVLRALGLETLALTAKPALVNPHQGMASLFLTNFQSLPQTGHRSPTLPTTAMPCYPPVFQLPPRVCASGTSPTSPTIDPYWLPLQSAM